MPSIVDWHVNSVLQKQHAGEPSLADLPSDVINIVLQRTMDYVIGRCDLQNALSKVCWPFRNMVLSTDHFRFPSMLNIAYKLPRTPSNIIDNFIRMLHERGIVEGSLFYGVRKYFYEHNSLGLEILMHARTAELKQPSSGVIPLATYSYAMGLVCGHDFTGALIEFRRIWRQMNGRMLQRVTREAFRSMIGQRNFAKLPLNRFCYRYGKGHWGSGSAWVIYGCNELDITCESCLLGVELRKVRLGLGFDYEWGRTRIIS